ncbi:hypothetical protein C8Q75DRAFT_717725 [Abortiporus biennis]|nr:hypothetical protein C8Q75DRAFT_717725 [Abortiporus biennis]
MPAHEPPKVSLDRSRSRSRRPSIDKGYRTDGEEGPRSPRLAPRPPLPPLPSAEVVNSYSSPPHPPKIQPSWHQRVFVGSTQRFNQVEVTGSTTAGDVLRILESQSMFPEGSGGGWMLWEVCQDFGMERPMRSFELLSDVSSSWNSEKTVNVFMAKCTPLAPVLSRSAIPSSSPMFSGWVQHEYKRGKWQKRWMELREHSLWLSKKETGKDQTFLCSLSNFDAYVATRLSKAPKAYAFSVKSTDNLSFFENTADYMHTFSCGEKEGEKWFEKILLARSYVLHQERNVLTTTSANPTTTASGASLSRSGTRKRPAQTLVNLSTPMTRGPSSDIPPVPRVFEPGSLLAQRGS